MKPKTFFTCVDKKKPSRANGKFKVLERLKR